MWAKDVLKTFEDWEQKIEILRVRDVSEVNQSQGDPFDENIDLKLRHTDLTFILHFKMLNLNQILWVISPMNHFFPLFKLLFIIQNNSIPLDFLRSDVISEIMQFTILNSIVDILMSDIFPCRVPLIDLGLIKWLLKIGFAIDLGVTAAGWLFSSIKG